MNDASSLMPSRSPIAITRALLSTAGVDDETLSDSDAVHLACAINGVETLPETAAWDAPITAHVWLAAALTARGRYRAPEVDGHRADLGDHGPLVDSAALMLVIQRHCLPTPMPGWSDEELADAFHLPNDALARAEAALQRAIALVPPPGPGPQALKPWVFRAYLRVLGIEHIIPPHREHGPIGRGIGR